jgi:hypothetical protein
VCGRENKISPCRFGIHQSLRLGLEEREVRKKNVIHIPLGKELKFFFKKNNEGEKEKNQKTTFL